jgi:hypothetical protein
MAKIVYATFRIELTDDADVDEVISDLDYTITHDAIISTELVGSSDEEV